MPWYAAFLLAALALFALYMLLIMPRFPRRPLGELAGKNYAHRGLWDVSRPENSLPAFAAAAEAGFGMELDVHLTRDYALVVFHDDTLERMCGVKGRVEDASLEKLSALHLVGTEETIPTLEQVLALTAGRVPLIVEIKPDRRYQALCRRVRECLRNYPGAYCVESFHPLVVRWFRRNAPEVIRGQLAYGLTFQRAQGKRLTFLDWAVASLLSNAFGRPDFIAHDEASARSLPLRLARLYRPHLAAWTVRSGKRMRELRDAWSMQIFEGFLPPPPPHAPEGKE